MTLPISTRLISFIVVTALGLAALLIMPMLLDSFSLLQAILFVAVAILALSQAFLWGYAGILSFGQAAFLVSVDIATPSASSILAIQQEPSHFRSSFPQPWQPCLAISCSTGGSAMPMSG